MADVLPIDHGRPDERNGMEGPNRLWISFVLVGFVVLGVAAFEFFRYPLHTNYWLLMIFVGAAALPVALAVLVVAVVRALQAGPRSPWVVGLVAVLGCASVTLVDLDSGYPYVYFHAHRSDFAAAAAFADGIPVGQDGYGFGWLPRGQDDLAGGYINVGPSPNGSRAAVLWMYKGSEGGFGYAYAPWARSDDVVTPSYWSMAPAMALGDGWWWVSNL